MKKQEYRPAEKIISNIISDNKKKQSEFRSKIKELENKNSALSKMNENLAKLNSENLVFDQNNIDASYISITNYYSFLEFDNPVCDVDDCQDKYCACTIFKSGFKVDHEKSFLLTSKEKLKKQKYLLDIVYFTSTRYYEPENYFYAFPFTYLKDKDGKEYKIYIKESDKNTLLRYDLINSFNYDVDLRTEEICCKFCNSCGCEKDCKWINSDTNEKYCNCEMTYVPALIEELVAFKKSKREKSEHKNIVSNALKQKEKLNKYICDKLKNVGYIETLQFVNFDIKTFNKLNKSFSDSAPDLLKSIKNFIIQLNNDIFASNINKLGINETFLKMSQ